MTFIIPGRTIFIALPLRFLSDHASQSYFDFASQPVWMLAKDISKLLSCVIPKELYCHLIFSFSQADRNHVRIRGIAMGFFLFFYQLAICP